MPRLAVVSFLVLCAAYAVAQNPPSSDPFAVSLAQQSVTAMTGGTPISDADLTGNATWIAGSDNETGTATLRVKGISESRVDLNLSGGTRTEIRNDTAGFPQGASVIGGGNQQPWALHNCWINAGWFFPALSFLASTADPNLIFSYIGQESHNGTVQHIRIYRYLSGQKTDVISLTQRLSTMEVYLDAGSLLPVAFAFNTHSSDDGMTDIAIEIDFSGYQAVNGIKVPFHIQKFIEGGLAVDNSSSFMLSNCVITPSFSQCKICRRITESTTTPTSSRNGPDTCAVVGKPTHFNILRSAISKHYSDSADYR